MPQSGVIPARPIETGMTWAWALLAIIWLLLFLAGLVALAVLQVLTLRAAPLWRAVEPRLSRVGAQI